MTVAGLAAHVALPGIRAVLEPAADVLLAGTADLGAGRSDVDVSAIGTNREGNGAEYLIKAFSLRLIRTRAKPRVR